MTFRLRKIGGGSTLRGGDAFRGAAPAGSDITVGSIASEEDVPGLLVPVAQAVELGDIVTGEALGAPSVYEPNAFELPPIATEPNVPGIGINQTYPAGAPAVPRIRAWLYDEDFATELGELDESFAKGWQDPLSDPGGGRVSLLNDDEDLADCTMYRIVRLDLDGLACFPMLIEGRTRHEIAAGEEADQFTTLRGRSILAEWEDGGVYPEAGAGSSPFADDRLFNFASSDLDTSSWPGVYTASLADNFEPAVGASTNVVPNGWPDSSAFKIWASHAPGGAFAPIGDVYVRSEFVVASAGPHRVYGAGDDFWELWIDGVPLLKETRPYGFRETASIDIDLSAGTHTIAMRGTNAGTVSVGNVAWLLASVMAVSASDGLPTGAVVRTDASWVGLGYPATPPGFTPGMVIRILLEEAQARGALLGWTLGFSDTVDSAGNGWPVTAELAFPVGLDNLGALRQLAETYADVAVAPSTKRLDAWNIGTKGHVTAVELAGGENLLELTHEVGG